MRPRLQAETSVDTRSAVWRTSGPGWTVTTDRRLVVLDYRLQPVAAFPLPDDVTGTHATHTVSPDARHAAVSLTGRVALVDAGGGVVWQVGHEPWANGASGSAWITADGLVWATVPGSRGPGSADRCLLLTADDGRLLADVELDGQFSGSEPIGHPGGILLGLSAGGGDSGSRIYSCRHDASGTHLDRMPGVDRVLADVHRSGQYYLTTNHDHEDVAVHRVYDGSVLARRSAQEVFGAEDFIDFQAAFVTDRRIIVRSVLEQQHMVLDAATLEVIGPVDYPDGAARDAVLPAGEGAWVTTDWLDGHVQLWAADQPL